MVDDHYKIDSVIKIETSLTHNTIMRLVKLFPKVASYMSLLHKLDIRDNRSSRFKSPRIEIEQAIKYYGNGSKGIHQNFKKGNEWLKKAIHQIAYYKDSNLIIKDIKNSNIYYLNKRRAEDMVGASLISAIIAESVFFIILFSS